MLKYELNDRKFACRHEKNKWRDLTYFFFLRCLYCTTTPSKLYYASHALKMRIFVNVMALWSICSIFWSIQATETCSAYVNCASRNYICSGALISPLRFVDTFPCILNIFENLKINLKNNHKAPTSLVLSKIHYKAPSRFLDQLC